MDISWPKEICDKQGLCFNINLNENGTKPYLKNNTFKQLHFDTKYIPNPDTNPNTNPYPNPNTYSSTQIEGVRIEGGCPCSFSFQSKGMVIEGGGGFTSV